MQSHLIKIIDAKISNMSDTDVSNRLKEISEQLPVTHSSILLNIKDESTIENIRRNYLKMIEGLKIWIESDHDKGIADELGINIITY